MLFCVLLGLLLFSNLSSGFYVNDQERIIVRVNPKVNLEDVVARQTGARVEDVTNGVVQVPLGSTGLYEAQFAKDPDVQSTAMIRLEPTFYPSLYLKNVQTQLKNYLRGDIGMIVYSSNLQRGFPITEQFWGMTLSTLRYFIPALLTGMLLGTGLALLSVIKPKVGRVLDGVHLILQGLPDFLVVFLLQFGAILIARAADRKVFLIMQFQDEVPILIPFLAVTILPTALIYGALRIALQREWEEPYVKTGFMKGLSRRHVVLVHLFRNTFEDLLAVFPRVVSTAIASMVIAEVMTAVIGLGGYAINRNIEYTNALPVTCAVLAMFAISAHLIVALVRKRYIIETKEGA